MANDLRWQLRLGSWAADIYTLTPAAESLTGALRDQLSAAGFSTDGRGATGTYLAVSSPAVPDTVPTPAWAPSETHGLCDRFHWMLRHAHAADRRKDASTRAHRRRPGVFTFSWPSAEESIPVASCPALPQFHGLVMDESRISGHIMLLGLVLYLAAYSHVGRRGLVMHSSAVARGEEGFLFLGDSEAGKSTMARLSAAIGRPSLGDDMNLLIREGFGFSLAALPGPKIPDQGYGQARPRLRAVFKLVQDTSDSVKPLSVTDTTRFLFEGFHQVPAGRALSSRMRAQAFTTVCDIATVVPGYALHFRPTPDIWRLIDDLLPA